MRGLLLYVTLIFMGFIAWSCEPKDPIIPKEPEVITELSFVLTASDMSEVLEFNFKDLDGDGGNAPEITNAVLRANREYTGEIRMFNGNEEITGEIQEEDEDPQLFFESGINGLVISYDDIDGSGKPIGLKTKLVTGDAGSGSLLVTLRHLPIKSASGVESGEIANAGGETDIEVIFDVNVE